MATQSAAFAQAPLAQPSTAKTHQQIQSNPIPDPPRMVDYGQLRVAPNNSELKISVQLPELGKVEVRAVTAHDVTTAHLTAFSHDALPILAAGRTDLEQALKSRDVVLGSFSSQTQGQSAGHQRQQSFQSSAPHSGGAASTGTTTGASAATPETSTGSPQRDYFSISVRA